MIDLEELQSQVKNTSVLRNLINFDRQWLDPPESHPHDLSLSLSASLQAFDKEIQQEFHNVLLNEIELKLFRRVMHELINHCPMISCDMEEIADCVMRSLKAHNRDWICTSPEICLTLQRDFTYTEIAPIQCFNVNKVGILDICGRQPVDLYCDSFLNMNSLIMGRQEDGCGFFLQLDHDSFLSIADNWDRSIIANYSCGFFPLGELNYTYLSFFTRDRNTK